MGITKSSTKHTFQHIKLTIFVKTAWPDALLLQRCPQRPLSRKLSLPRICNHLTWQYLAILHSHLQLYNLAVFSNWISIKDTHLNTQIFHVWLCFDIRYCRCIMFRTILILFCRYKDPLVDFSWSFWCQRAKMSERGFSILLLSKKCSLTRIYIMVLFFSAYHIRLGKSGPTLLIMTDVYRLACLQWNLWVNIQLFALNKSK